MWHGRGLKESQSASATTQGSPADISEKILVDFSLLPEEKPSLVICSKDVSFGRLWYKADHSIASDSDCTSFSNSWTSEPSKKKTLVGKCPDVPPGNSFRIRLLQEKQAASHGAAAQMLEAL